MKSIVVIVALLIVSFSTQAKAISYIGNEFVEICLEGTENCTVGTITKYGAFVSLIKPGTTLRGKKIGDIIQIGPLGDRIAAIQPALYAELKKLGMQRYFINPQASQAEIDAIQRQLDSSFRTCGVGSIGCGAGLLAGLGGGPWGLALAALACWQNYESCRNLDLANKDLFIKRAALEKAMEEEGAEKEAAEAAAGTSGGSGGGSGGGRPERPTTTIWEGTRPLRPGIGIIVDPPGGRPTFGGGGGGISPGIRLN